MLGLSLTLGATALRGAGGGAPPAPTFDPATLFLNPSTDAGFILDVATDHMWNGQSGYAHASAGQSVREALSRYYQIGSYAPGSSDPGPGIFVQDTATKRPLLQAEGALRYLQFDGVDDWMSLASLDMGGSDAVTVIAGLRRGQRANMEDVLGLSASPHGNFGTYRLCPTFDAASDNAAFTSLADEGIIATARAASTLVSTDYVLTGIGDISSDTAVVRRNGVQLGSSATNQGGGEYRSDVVYLGSRGGTARFFNGRLYGLIVVNRILTAEELAASEKWMASKMGLTL